MATPGHPVASWHSAVARSPLAFRFQGCWDVHADAQRPAVIRAVTACLADAWPDRRRSHGWAAVVPDRRAGCGVAVFLRVGAHTAPAFLRGTPALEADGLAAAAGIWRALPAWPVAITLATCRECALVGFVARVPRPVSPLAVPLSRAAQQPRQQQRGKRVPLGPAQPATHCH